MCAHCRVVGEMVRGGNAHSRTQSLQDLDRFVKHPRSLASNVSVSARLGCTASPAPEVLRAVRVSSCACLSSDGAAPAGGLRACSEPAWHDSWTCQPADHTDQDDA